MRDNERNGIIAWFVYNPVAANLLMVLILISGLLGWYNIKKKTFPEITPNTISISVPYPGAAPQEVEESVVIKIEEALDGLEGIEEMTGWASEGLGRVMVEVETGYDLATMLDDIKLRVDAISSFPEETEKPVIARQQIENPVIWVSVYGDVDERTLKTWAQIVRDEIVQLPEVSVAQIQGGRDYEISVLLDEYRLLKYGLTFDEVARAIRAHSLDVPGGIIRTEGGNILLRTKGQAYTGDDFGRIPVRTRPDGTALLLREVAEIEDGFEEWSGIAEFNGQPAISISVKSVGDQNDIHIADQVEAYVAQKVLPGKLHLAAWGNSAFYLKDRQDMMFRNLFTGAVLVFLLLTLFLRFKVALWVIMGIPLSFLGTVWLMPTDLFGNLTINLLSLFGFILVLGILVDDAIVIGESVYSEIQRHGHTPANVIRGARKVAMPATFGVLTTMAAFIPMLMVQGTAGKFWLTIGMVVIISLIFSLIESKLILPSHLAHMKLKKRDAHGPWMGRLVRMQRFFADGMERFAAGPYLRLLEKALAWRYTTLALFVAGLILVVGLIGHGKPRFVFFPNVASDFIMVSLVMEDGTPAATTNARLHQIDQALRQVAAEYRQQHPEEPDPVRYVMLWTDSETRAQMVVELTKPEQRSIDTHELIRRWRERVGEIPAARELRIRGATHSGGGAPVAFRLTGNDYDQLEAAARALQARMADYEGTFDIENSFQSGNEEIRLHILPAGEALGLTQAQLGQQVRQAFYGAEAQRIQRGKDEVKVMVRYPLQRRQSLHDLENMRIRTPQGDAVPLKTVARLELGESAATIRRVDGMRAVSVTSDIDTTVAEPRQVTQDILARVIPQLRQQYPQVHFSLEGASQERQELMGDLARAGIITLLVIFALMAIPLKSYTQPLIIMSVIPFGIIGAVVGHLLLDRNLSILSLFGIIALAGVVVNDSLVMVDFINQERRAGIPIHQAIRDAGVKRFRAIMLTSLTTFFGLIPILMETSLQAQIVIPMAISLAFGILFATVITLFMVPALYLVGMDIRKLFRSGESTARQQPGVV